MCALLASELPSLPPEVATEVTNFFRSHFIVADDGYGAWRKKMGRSISRANRMLKPEAFLATVYGAMLSARAYGKPEVFSTMTCTGP